MYDLIERQAAIDVLHGYFDGMLETDTWSPCDVYGLIEILPSAQSEIIKCRDCKYWDKTWTNDWAEYYHYCPMVDGVRKADFYCADAERRTDE